MPRVGLETVAGLLSVPKVGRLTEKEVIVVSNIGLLALAVAEVLEPCVSLVETAEED